MKNLFFSISSPIFLKHVSNGCICCADYKNIHIMGSKHPIGPIQCSVHALHSMPRSCASFEGTKPHDVYVFGISAVNAVNWIMFEKRLENIFKKDFFILWSLFGFWAVCKVVFWPREGQNLKLSEEPIKKNVSTCLRITHVHGELEIPKFYFAPPP